MITLQEIKTAQEKLAEMISAFSAQAMRRVVIPTAEIELNDGEEYAGIILGNDGAPDYHLILLHGEAESVNWKDAKKFATRAGGELPTRREQSLLYANLKDQFSSNWYWSDEQHAAGSGYVWYQFFFSGLQSTCSKDHELRARAIRRIAYSNVDALTGTSGKIPSVAFYVG